MAQFGLARLTGGQEVAGSNPVSPTKENPAIAGFFVYLDIARIKKVLASLRRTKRQKRYPTEFTTSIRKKST